MTELAQSIISSLCFSGQANGIQPHVLPKKVAHIMHRGVITVQTDTYASKAASLMAENRIGALPVVDNKNKLVGILSATDILKVFAILICNPNKMLTEKIPIEKIPAENIPTENIPAENTPAENFPAEK